MNKESKIYVAGHRGMVGSAIVRKLKQEGYVNVLTRPSAELDLVNQQAVNDFFRQKNRISFSWQLPGLAASWQIIPTGQSLYIAT